MVGRVREGSEKGQKGVIRKGSEKCLSTRVRERVREGVR